MSRVIYTPIGLTATRDADTINTILDDISDASVVLDASNFAEEGIDRTVYEGGSHGRRRARIVTSTRTTVVPQAMGVLACPTNLRTGTLGALLDNEALRIRSLIRITSTVSDGRGFDPTAADTYRFQHAWFDGSLPTHVVASSRRHRTQIAQGALDVRQAHADFLWESWLVGPVADLDWIQVEYENVGTGDIEVDLTNLTVDEFRRVTVS